MVDDDNIFKGKTDEYIIFWIIDTEFNSFEEIKEYFFKEKNEFPNENILKVKLFAMKEDKLIKEEGNKYFITKKGFEKFEKERRDSLFNYELFEEDQKKEIKRLIVSWTGFEDMVLQFWQIRPFFYDKSNIWWLWNVNKNRWEMVDEVDLMNGIDSLLDTYSTSKGRVKNEILECMKKLGRKKLPLNLSTSIIQFEDKLFDIRTGKISKVTPAYFCTNPLPWSIGISDSTPTIDKLFKDWVGEKYVQTLYEIIAYCVLPNYPIHLIFCLTGCGRNGKSKFQGLVSKFIGMENLCSTELDTLLESRFESAKLYRKLICLLGETNFGKMKKTSLLKKLSGQDIIGYEFKNKKPFDGQNYAKILINTNSLPTTNDTSDGFYRRWFIIDFPNSFPEGKDILKIIPDVEYNNLCRKVINILPGLIEKGKFTNQGSIEERRKNYILASNPLSIFIKDHCEVAYTHEEKFGYFYNCYVSYLKKNKRRIISKKELSKNLSIEGFSTQFVRRSENGTVSSFTAILGIQVNGIFNEAKM